jgi:hypothetical protein
LAVVALAAVMSITACGSESGPEGAFDEFHSQPALAPPAVDVTQEKDGKVSPGYVFVAPKKAAKMRGPLIVANDGQVVWFKQVGPREATDFKVQRYRHKPVLTWWEGTSKFGIGKGAGMIYDSSYRKIAEVRAGHGYQADLHEFRLTPRGTALLVIYHAVPATGLEKYGGQKKGLVQDGIIQEIDVATRKVLFEWHSVGHVGLDDSYTRIRKVKKKERTIYAPFDYFHPNSITLDSNGNFLVSGRNTRALYLISRSTGRILWRLGGKESDFKMGPGTRFAWQHDAELHPDGTLTLFDNESMPKVGDQSRGLLLHVDVHNRTVTLKKAYVHPKKLLAPHQGNLQLLPDGHAFVGWGGIPYFTEFDKDGNVVFDAHMAKGLDTYRSYRFEWHATPASPPRIALSARKDGRVSVWASWNGATEVARWQVLVGDAANDLKPAREVNKVAFETQVTLTAKGRWIAVRALDSASRTLATSVPKRMP